MKRLTIGSIALVLTIGATLAAQSKDFNGTWVLDPAKSTNQGPPKFTIVMDAKTFTLKPDEASAPEVVFSLDGKETQVGNQRRTAAWRGNQLDLTVIGARGPMTITLSREGAWLVQEAPNGRDGARTKLYYKKSGS